jgi:CheY-like chemotaxis protein
MTKVLVIEDDEVLRESILDILGTRNFDVIGAEDGRRGLELAKEFVPDLILCDVRMPKLNGYEVLQAIRQDPKTAAIPLIFLTAETIQNVVGKGQNLGANGYLIKPFSTADLLEAINQGQRDR